ncbi:MAG TPA: PPOX class F420-dependent oxidoreductase [Nocardioidaceae bacterium]|nr:PPOX class F420-dependent oxidoreductase [Nocardioidaceae bacterium]
MEVEEARQFVRRHHHAVLATRTPGGGVQQSPVLAGVDGEGRFVVSSRETAFKTRNLRANPWAQLCVVTDRFFGSWVYVEGDAEVVSLPEAMEPLVDYYRALSGEHEDWDDYREAMRRDRRVLIRVTARRAGPDRAG